MRKLSMPELQRKSIEEYKQAKHIPLILVLDNIRSLQNVGSAFRTADCFLVEAIYLCGITAQPPHRDIRKTALGAEESVSWRYFETADDAITKIKEQDCNLLAIEQTNQKTYLDKWEFNFDKKTALVFGNELKGVSQTFLDAVDGVVEIPQRGTKHSLNISSSLAILSWEFARQFGF